MGWEHVLNRVDKLLSRVERIWGREEPELPDWSRVTACRWRSMRGGGCCFYAVRHPHPVRLRDLCGIEAQKALLERNTLQFLQRLPANNVLLWGAKGTGKSSLVKALLNEYQEAGLRLVEVDKQDLLNLPEIVEFLRPRPQRFIIFCDDLSFSQEDSGYTALKSVLDGSIAAPPENVLIYVTSNRRHLLPEFMRENLDARNVDGEIHHGEAVEEKISLSERFGLWVGFYPFKQDEYLEIADYWLRQFGVAGIEDAATREAALRWALLRGSRSGRAAWQFARDWAGQARLE
jgi:predicted AAA+ superfamily ATPase